MSKRKEDLIPPGDAIGLMDDGSINIGPPEVMLPKMAAARRETEEAIATVEARKAAEAREADEDDISDLDDYDELFKA
jgi:hypothetical protein